MAICKESMTKIMMMLGKDEASEVYRLASQQDALETIWRIKVERFYERITDIVLDSLMRTGKIPTDLPFEEFFSEHAFDVASQSFRSVGTLPKAKLAKPPKGKIPKNLRDLMIEWDYWRKKGKVPPRQKKISEGVKKAYIKKVQTFWERNSDDFREGDRTKVFDQQKAREAIRKASQQSQARATMIVETETTYYYNQVRRKVYDQSNDITHYLFVAVRDRATTHWCATRQGIVFKKGDPLLEAETPPIHWNCRSEILPLTPLNPNHKRLIEDQSRQRRNRSPEPLPKGWGKR
jgi:SPP1 gp7 family putative phage head morphogenesis protein